MQARKHYNTNCFWTTPPPGPGLNLFWGHHAASGCRQDFKTLSKHGLGQPGTNTGQFRCFLCNINIFFAGVFLQLFALVLACCTWLFLAAPGWLWLQLVGPGCSWLLPLLAKLAYLLLARFWLVRHYNQPALFALLVNLCGV